MRVPVRIVTDSASDLSQALADELGIRIVPLTVRLGSDDFLDRVGLSPSELWARCSTASGLPETAAPAPAQFERTYRGLADAGAREVVVVTVSSLLSGTMQSAELAARSLTGSLRIAVVDSRSATTGLGMIAVAAARRANAGGSLADVVTLVQDLAGRTQVCAALESLDHVGVRTGGARARLASALALKPIVELREGRFGPVGYQRSRSSSLRALVHRVQAAGPIDALGVFHADSTDVDRLVTSLALIAPAPLMVTDVGAAAFALCGRGAVGVAYQRRSGPNA